MRYKILLQRLKQLSCGTKEDIINILNLIGYTHITITEPEAAAFVVTLVSDEILEKSGAVYVGYGYGGYGLSPYGGKIGKAVTEIVLDILKQIKAAGVKVTLMVDDLISAKTISDADVIFSFTASTQQLSSGSNSFDINIIEKPRTISDGEVKYGYGYFGYGEFGYGGVW